MGINYKESQGQTERAVALKEEEESHGETIRCDAGMDKQKKNEMSIVSRLRIICYLQYAKCT